MTRSAPFRAEPGEGRGGLGGRVLPHGTARPLQRPLARPGDGLGRFAAPLRRYPRAPVAPTGRGRRAGLPVPGPHLAGVALVGLSDPTGEGILPAPAGPGPGERVHGASGRPRVVCGAGGDASKPRGCPPTRHKNGGPLGASTSASPRAGRRARSATAPPKPCATSAGAPSPHVPSGPVKASVRAVSEASRPGYRSEVPSPGMPRASTGWGDANARHIAPHGGGERCPVRQRHGAARTEPVPTHGSAPGRVGVAESPVGHENRQRASGRGGSRPARQPAHGEEEQR